MKFERTEVMGMFNALYGMRNPMNSWNKRDSYRSSRESDFFHSNCVIGENDLKLGKTLVGAGSPHGKFARMIHVQVQITAPIYWWKEMDTYKIGTTANSTSTMHKLLSQPITNECFENPVWQGTLERLEDLRQTAVDLKNENNEAWKVYWKDLVNELPMGWLQTRMWDTNYAVLRNIVRQRANHKLTEWHQFVDWVKTLPYANELIFAEK